MDKETVKMHLRAGREYGRESTCGNKVDYKTENSAQAAAYAMNGKGASHESEAYPCAWCAGWHIGRKMTEEEMVRFSN